MNTPSPSSGIAPLSHWGLIRARGADAVSFLHGQLTNDVANLPPGSYRLAGFCSAKGRLQASFLIWKSAEDELMLACARSVLPATLKRLSMFVLRARCKLSDASGELGLYGALGAAAGELLGDSAVGSTRTTATGTVLHLPAVDGVPRAIVAVDLARAPAVTLPVDLWRLFEVRSGVAMVEAETAEQFVPQMLNYEIVGAVDFQKGCYPGQEVVARSQYRGTIKRRMFLFQSSVPASSGQEVFHDADPSQPAGMVVNAAAYEGGFWALVEVKLAALERGTLQLGMPEGPALRRAELPYEVMGEGTAPA